MKPTIIKFKPLGDTRGSLVAIESDIGIPFPIRRVYYIFSTKVGVERGFHAHKDLQQIAVAVMGSCEIILDDGDEQISVLLDNSTKGLHIDPGVWHVMRNFTPDCVLLVLADQHYDESDYIRSYDKFLKWKKK